MKIFAARRLCVLLLAVAAFASHSSNAQDCGEPVVSLGEVMAGLQAGLTAGVHNLNALPSGYDVAASFEPRRGFIIPETEVSSIQCENDFLLVSGWFACALTNYRGETFRTPKEARDCVNNGLNGLVEDFYFKVDGIEVGHMQTASKIGHLPSYPYIPRGERRAAFFAVGHIIEPFSLSVGPHKATLFTLIDWDRDGPNPAEWDELTAYFEVIAVD